MTETDRSQQQEQQSERMRRAVERKSAESREQAEANRLQSEQESLAGDDRGQDAMSIRAKNSGHGKKTADKWNQ